MQRILLIASVWLALAAAVCAGACLASGGTTWTPWRILRSNDTSLDACCVPKPLARVPATVARTQPMVPGAAVVAADASPVFDADAQRERESELDRVEAELRDASRASSASRTASSGMSNTASTEASNEPPNSASSTTSNAVSNTGSSPAIHSAAASNSVPALVVAPSSNATQVRAEGAGATAQATSQRPAPTPPKPTPPDERPQAQDPDEDDVIHGEPSFGGLGPLPKGVPAEEEGLGVTVVHGASLSPIVDAQIRYLLEADLALLRAEDPQIEALDDQDLLERATRSARTNATGWAMLDSMAGTIVVSARAGNLYSSFRVQAGEIGHKQLALYPDTTLVLRARDTEGKALVGVPVVVRNTHGKPLWSARTGADGNASLRHANSYVRERDPRFGARDAALDVPGAAPILLGDGLMPELPLDLSVPSASGVARIRVLDVADKTCELEGSIEIAPVGALQDLAARRWRVLAAGRADFDHLPLGGRFEVLVRTRCGPEDLRAEFAGPTRAGEAIDVELRHARSMPRVAARLVDDGGRPLANWTVQSWLRARQSDGCPVWRLQDSAQTDADGRVRLDVRERADGQELSLVARNPWGRTKGLEVHALDDLAPELVVSPPLVDLGEIHAVEWPPIAGGTVVDGLGQPLADAEVELLRDGCADPRVTRSSNAHGKFDLRAVPGKQALTVRATSVANKEGDTATVRPGTRDLRLSLPSFGGLAGRVLVPDAASAHNVQIVLRHKELPEFVLSADEEGAFEFERLTAGVYDLTARVTGFDQPLFIVREVRVRPGITVRDERLNALDLRSRICVLKLLFVDEDDRPIVRGSISGVRKEGAGPRMFEIENGNAVVVIPCAGGSLEIVSEGHETLRLHSISDGMRVTLRRKTP